MEFIFKVTFFYRENIVKNTRKKIMQKTSSVVQFSHFVINVKRTLNFQAVVMCM